jgi:uncharacterized damage-inducible protein DinB
MASPLSLPALVELFDFNYWARDRHLQVCEALTEEQIWRPLVSSFPSLGFAIAHMVIVEWLWLERWQGRPPHALQSPEAFSSLAALSARWRLVESEMKAYLAQLDERALEQPFSYVNLEGQTWTYPLWHTMLHLINHQTYHRGQVAGLLRQLGVQPPGVDFLVGKDMGLRL